MSTASKLHTSLNHYFSPYILLVFTVASPPNIFETIPSYQFLLLRSYCQQCIICHPHQKNKKKQSIHAHQLYIYIYIYIYVYYKFYHYKGYVAHNSKIAIKCIIYFIVNSIDQINSYGMLLLIFARLLYP